MILYPYSTAVCLNIGTFSRVLHWECCYRVYDACICIADVICVNYQPFHFIDKFSARKCLVEGLI